jgi:hypothetical protein
MLCAALGDTPALAQKPGGILKMFSPDSASYAGSLKAFVALSRSLIRGKSDPEAFAAALQNSGKLGIDIRTGAKVPDYVDGVAGTIRGLRPILAGRRI